MHASIPATRSFMYHEELQTTEHESPSHFIKQRRYAVKFDAWKHWKLWTAFASRSGTISNIRGAVPNRIHLLMFSTTVPYSKVARLMSVNLPGSGKSFGHPGPNFSIQSHLTCSRGAVVVRSAGIRSLLQERQTSERTDSVGLHVVFSTASQ